ncbi:hypothetical protein CHELA20_54312 [Hyphomicrobiales bacterium]|nr:hypothetical protein CHELA41_20616 [Hyphomicrobiales bacterium]CAH1686012.1 hypothetical protein CHELA20_54312 [Hyphomicrobiales bacterium]
MRAKSIRMNNVLPGWIDSLPATEERRDSVPMRRFGKAEEIAATIAFLLSDAAGYHRTEYPGRWRRDPRGLIPHKSITCGSGGGAGSSSRDHPP